MRGPSALCISLFILAHATLVAGSKAADAKGKSEFSLKNLVPSIQWGISEIRFVDLLWILQCVNMGYQKAADRQGGWLPFSFHHRSSHPAKRKLNKAVCVQGLDHRAPRLSMCCRHTQLVAQQRISQYKSWNFAPCLKAFVEVTLIS